MGYGLVDNNTLSNIANAIREKTNSNSVYYPSEMSLAIRQIETGGNGFSTPVVRSTLPWADAEIQYGGAIQYNFKSNNGLINTYYMEQFEFTNNIDENANIISKVDWDSYSKGNVYLYERNNKNIYGLYVDGNHLANDISILDMTGICAYAESYQGNAFCTPLTQIMDFSFANCRNLTNPVCGSYVKSMRYAYANCENLTSAICGNNVTDMTGAFRGCYNIRSGVSGPEVVSMHMTYSGSYNIRNIEIGDKVKDISYMANSISYLTDVYGNCNNVENGQWAFAYDYNLANVPTMRYLKDGEYMFCDCYNLSNNTIYEFTNKTHYLENAYSMFYNCMNIESVFIWNHLNNAASMFVNCFNLKNVQSEATNLCNVEYMFKNCYNLTTQIEIPNSVNSITGMYQNCLNLIGDVEIPSYVNRIGNAYGNCENIGDAAVLCDSLYPSEWSQANAFGRVNYTNRRNIVVTHLNTWNNFLAFNCAGNWNKAYDNSTETEVFVNEKSYNCVRCAYNTSYNCYVYCTE